MKRRICLIAESLDRRRGGAEIYLAELVESFAQAGHPVRALVRRPVTAPSSAEIEAVPTLRVRGWLREWHFARAIRNRLAGTSDIVFSTLPVAAPEVTHYLSPAALYRTGFEAERASFDPGLRQRFYRLGNRLNLQRQWLLAAQERLLAREPRVKVLSFSAAARASVLDLFHAPAANVASIPPGVDLTRFRPGPAAPVRSERLRLLFAGQNFHLKGLHCLLRALAEAERRGLRANLTVLGGGSSGPFKSLAGSLGLADRVHFLGSVASEAVPETYRSSDALVHPTFADHCSLVVLEALASGLPVVTTRANGAAELIASGREGFIVEDPRDIDALAAALLRMQDREKLKAMRGAAIALRPQLGSADHARRVLAWLTGG
jgi:UDP-glucose:(heptosyl)LPS alpha-1,3-glucosyltransferase